MCPREAPGRCRAEQGTTLPRNDATVGRNGEPSIDQYMRHYDRDALDPLMSLKIVERAAFTVVGMEIVTRPKSPDIPNLWPRFIARIDEIPELCEPRVSYGVMWNGDSMDVLHYLAAVSVAKRVLVPKGMTLLTLPAGTYASFSYPLSGLAKGFGEIFGRLLPESGHTQALAPFFERYDEAFDPANPRSAVEICMPIRKRNAPP
jgi:AraC family transcriptional regulator